MWRLRAPAASRGMTARATGPELEAARLLAEAIDYARQGQVAVRRGRRELTRAPQPLQ